MSTRPNKRPLALRLVKRWPSLQAKRWATSKLNRLALQAGTAAIIGIGSAVRSAHRPGSDVDFLIVSDSETSADAGRPFDVDLRTFRTSEVDDKLRERDEFLGSALHFGRAIFERAGYWAGLGVKWRDQMLFPSPEPSITRALRCERFARELVSMGDLDAALEQVIGMLTHWGRAKLFSAHVYPASRPELPAQLRIIEECSLAASLELALHHRQIDTDTLRELKRLPTATRRRFETSTRSSHGVRGGVLQPPSNCRRR
jgi:predicted nucleotidyltransferase